jgi:hypothetical protein
LLSGNFHEGNLSQVEPGTFGDADADVAWAEEIERRCAAVDAGEAVTSDWEAVRSRIEREIFHR